MTPARIFRTKIINPVLEEMGLLSIEASDLLLGTALHESKLKYVHQDGGPARGMFQMEPNTLKDLFENYLSYRPDKKALLIKYAEAGLEPTDPINLYNPRYATAAARLQYLRKEGKIPENPQGQAEYWKAHWNTELGAGTVEQYLEAWNSK